MSNELDILNHKLRKEIITNQKLTAQLKEKEAANNQLLREVYRLRDHIFYIEDVLSIYQQWFATHKDIVHPSQHPVTAKSSYEYEHY